MTPKLGAIVEWWNGAANLGRQKQKD